MTSTLLRTFLREGFEIDQTGVQDEGDLAASSQSLELQARLAAIQSDTQTEEEAEKAKEDLVAAFRLFSSKSRGMGRAKALKLWIDAREVRFPGFAESLENDEELLQRLLNAYPARRTAA